MSLFTIQQADDALLEWDPSPKEPASTDRRTMVQRRNRGSDHWELTQEYVCISRLPVMTSRTTWTVGSID